MFSVMNASQKDLPNDESGWRDKLTPEQYRILRQKGTEAPFSGEYYHSTEKGIYLCAACGHQLFASDTKYDSGSGWPSFWEPVNQASVMTAPDDSHGMKRTEIMCSRCGSHLGHVFDDGPADKTGQRFCVNSASLRLKKE